MPTTQDTPKTTSTERRLERLHGKPIARLLADAISEQGSVRGAARWLDISESTCNTWMKKWGVSVQRRVVAQTKQPS